jgi:hypothetical protein
MEYFHFLSGGPEVINNASIVLKEKYALLENLIKKYRFAPFPPRPYKLINISEEYPPQDGYENNRQLNVISRAILLEHRLIKLWQEIGYYDIIQDTNDLVIQGQFLICYSPNNDLFDDYDTVYNKINTLYNLGYKITIQLLCDIYSVFENRMSLVGNDILKITSKIMKRSEEETLFNLFKVSMFTKHNFMSIRDFFLKDRYYIKDIYLNTFEQQINSTFSLLKEILQQPYDDNFFFNFQEIMPFEESFLV